jgi:hypothetical protein
MAKDEYKVQMQQTGGGRRKSFTLVNATNEAEARRTAEKHHAKGDNPKRILSAEKTGRSF